jgi:hypothetical protein
MATGATDVTDACCVEVPVCAMAKGNQTAGRSDRSCPACEGVLPTAPDPAGHAADAGTVTVTVHRHQRSARVATTRRFRLVLGARSFANVR